ncbi:MAG: ATP-dependent DNA helicase UvrD/PcrA, partial [uncultured Chloroflexia bacterium]
TAVHGIRDVDVRDAPLPADVVPAFLDYIGDATLVGHNIMNFDHRIVHRVAAAVGAVAPTNPLIDTCELARRLLPGTSHRLADLAQRWGIQSEQAHRAMNDVQVNGAVFEHLVDLLDADKELDALGNVLAIVALGIIASGMPIDGENAVLLDAGARKHASSPSSPLIARMAELVHDQTLDQARRFIADHPRSTWEDDERWERLAEHWRGQLEQYRASAADQSLASFLRYAARAKSLDAPDMAGRVTMMTIHASKGMEWPVVFLVGAENGTLPFSNVDASRMEEERRIMYVGMTRAKERLCLTWVKSVRGRETTYSPFLDDIPAQHLRTPRRQARQ